MHPLVIGAQYQVLESYSRYGVKSFIRHGYITAKHKMVLRDKAHWDFSKPLMTTVKIRLRNGLFKTSHDLGENTAPKRTFPYRS